MLELVLFSEGNRWGAGNAMNQLFYGDNLDILRDRIADESVDLIYLDPPFNSNRNYNVLFQEKSGEDSASQIEVFTDTWAFSCTHCAKGNVWTLEPRSTLTDRRAQNRQLSPWSTWLNQKQPVANEKVAREELSFRSKERIAVALRSSSLPRIGHSLRAMHA
jgi:DNA modification methylase